MNIRNFVIIAHIDHGKSTLADRFLELTKTVEKRKMKEQVLDQMDLERERGITIKLQPVRMKYTYQNDKCQITNVKKTLDSEYILNLIDTPGHVDFGYEVSRSLAAVEGAVLLIDATKGIQAQTLANLYLALEQNLVIIPVINKIDLPNAKVEETISEVASLIGVNKDEIIKISAKTGENVELILEEIVKKVPAPIFEDEKPLQALIFDSEFDTYKGVIAYVRVFEGQIKRGDKIKLLASRSESDAIEVGTFAPAMNASANLKSGEIGYIATGLKEIAACRVGDTISLVSNQAIPLHGYQEPSLVVYASFYPIAGDDYDVLKDGLSKLKLSDAAFSFEPESSEGLGRGFRCGFLGLLHLEIIAERIRREFNVDLIISTPSVLYKVVKRNGEEMMVYTPNDLPDPSHIQEMKEPWVKMEIVTPEEYLGGVMDLAQKSRGIYLNTTYLATGLSEKIQDGHRRAVLSYEVPLSEIIVDFYDSLKNVSSGYASMNYELIGWRTGDLVRLDFLIAEEKVDAFSRIVVKSQSFAEGRRLVQKLKDVLPRQNFTVAIQASIGGKIIARETLSPFRKDVTGYLYGGDVTRKMKLLEKQKKGKKRMKQMGRMNVPQDVFLEILKK